MADYRCSQCEATKHIAGDQAMTIAICRVCGGRESWFYRVDQWDRLIDMSVKDRFAEKQGIYTRPEFYPTGTYPPEKVYQRKIILVGAIQWMGDDAHSHPKVCLHHVPKGENGFRLCAYCDHPMYQHGQFRTGGKHIICPGDYIITEPSGKVHCCKPDDFERDYEEVQI